MKKYPQSNCSILKYVILLMILNKCLYEHIHIKSTDWEMTMKSMSIRCRFDDFNVESISIRYLNLKVIYFNVILKSNRFYNFRALYLFYPLILYEFIETFTKSTTYFKMEQFWGNFSIRIIRSTFHFFSNSNRI